jgi:hypothetical protein
LQIGKYLEKIKQEIIESELICTEQKKETELLEVKKSSTMQRTAEMLKKNRMTAEKLDWYLEMKTHLLASGHSEDDFELVLNAISLVKENGCDLLEIAAQFSENEQLKSSVRRLQVQSSVLEEKVRRLQEKARIAEEAIESKSQMQWHMVELEEMGFGFKQLKQFHNTIEEITQANDLSEADRSAVDIFLDHVRRHYDDILGFEKRLDELKGELQNLRILRLAQLNTISAQP